MWKNSLVFILLIFICSSCGIYSFTGAAIEGKTINIHFIENNARTIVPTLSATLTEKIRKKIFTQSSLSQVNAENTDYDLNGSITNYEVTVAAIQGQEQASKNRLSISIQIIFENRLDKNKSFSQTFTRFADFNSTQQISAIETSLINDIGEQLADDIYNKAFVNW